MRPAIRLAALSQYPAIFVFSHDSIGLGEDGPTHQPVEHLAALRSIPNLLVIADFFSLPMKRNTLGLRLCKVNCP